MSPSIEIRLEQVERENRRIKCIAIIGGLVVIAALTTAQVQPPTTKTVEAGQFRLLAADGKERAVLCMEGDVPVLKFKDANGKVRAVMGIRNNAPIVALTVEQEVPRTGMSVDKRRSGLIVWDEKGKTRAIVAVMKDIPGVVLTDEAEKPRVALTVEQNNAKIEFMDANGAPFKKLP